jgi:hypothetical protein
VQLRRMIQVSVLVRYGSIGNRCRCMGSFQFATVHSCSRKAVSMAPNFGCVFQKVTCSNTPDPPDPTSLARHAARATHRWVGVGGHVFQRRCSQKYCSG